MHINQWPNSLKEAQTIFDIFYNEIVRIKKKGWNVFIGIGITIVFYCVIPLLLFPLYQMVSFIHPGILIYMLTFLSNSMPFLVCNLIMNHVYSSKYHFFEQYKIQNKPWPWEVDEREYNQKYKGVVRDIIIGSTILGPIAIYITIYLNLVEYIVDSELFPPSFQLFKEAIYITIIFDALFYWIHRLFHTPWLYKKLHQQHHEFKTVVSITSIYSHPLDFLISTLLPTMIAFSILGKLHAITASYWIVNLSITNILSHTGYELSWYPWGVFPFGNNIDFHDFHHSAIVGNYGIFSSFWDIVCGTNKHYVNFIAKEERRKKSLR